MKKLILHIGTEKTGTTAIQEFLSLNRERFLDLGFFIPKSPSSSAPNHRKLATAFFNESRSDDSFQHFNIKNFENWRERVLTDVRGELQGCDTPVHIISSEHFSSRLTTRSEKADLYAFLNSIYDEIELVSYFRRQDQYAVSLYSTYLKSGGTEKRILPNSKNLSRYGYYEMCRDWEKVFGIGSLKARVFDRNELVSGNIVDDFCNILDVDVGGFLLAEGDVNPSLTHFGQEILRNTNHLLKKGLIGAKRHAEFVGYLESKYSGSPRLPKRSYVEQWYSQYAESNKLFFEKYCQSSNGFSEDFSKYPEDWAGTSFENHEILEEVFSFFMTANLSI